MSSVILSKFTDNMETMKNFIEIVNNPQILLDAGKMAREEIGLTNDEQQKAEEARKLIEENKNQLAKISISEEENKKAKSDNEAVAKQLSDKFADYNAQSDELIERVKKHTALEAQTIGLKSQLDQEKKDSDDIRQKNESEKLRLQSLESALAMRLENIKAREKSLGL